MLLEWEKTAKNKFQPSNVTQILDKVKANERNINTEGDLILAVKKSFILTRHMYILILVFIDFNRISELQVW